MPIEIRAGTSGYSYKEWRGAFYPPEVHQDEWLSYYASKLPAVEINNTFYRMPRKHVVETWRDSVPESFRFVIKASRRITHQSRLNNAAESTGYLLDLPVVYDLVNTHGGPRLLSTLARRETQFAVPRGGLLLLWGHTRSRFIH